MSVSMTTWRMDVGDGLSAAGMPVGEAADVGMSSGLGVAVGPTPPPHAATMTTTAQATNLAKTADIAQTLLAHSTAGSLRAR